MGYPGDNSSTNFFSPFQPSDLLQSEVASVEVTGVGVGSEEEGARSFIQRRFSSLPLETRLAPSENVCPVLPASPQALSSNNVASVWFCEPQFPHL